MLVAIREESGSSAMRMATLLDQIHGTVQQQEARRDHWMGIQKIVQDWPQHILSTEWWSGNRKHPPRRGLLATSESFRLLKLRQQAATCDRITFACLTERHRAGGPV